MSTFYTDSGSIDILNVTSLTATGSLFGTASFATTAQNVLGSITSASYADTASYVQQAVSASYAITASYALNSTPSAGTDFGKTIAITQIMYPFSGF